MTHVKICGVNSPAALKAAVRGGANYIGLVFYGPSPRCVPIETAVTFSGLAPDGVKVVGLFVDPSDEEIRGPVKYAWLDMIQLHGNESPARVKEIKAAFNVPVMKAFRIKSKDDLAHVEDYKDACDWFLFDAKVDEGAALPGGTGVTFDWNVLKDYDPGKPWMLAGGLNADNIAQALEALSPDAVDLSSGVEDSPGVKSPDKIAAFFDAIKATKKFRPNYLG